MCAGSFVLMMDQTHIAPVKLNDGFVRKFAAGVHVNGAVYTYHRLHETGNETDVVRNEDDGETLAEAAKQCVKVILHAKVEIGRRLVQKQ